MLMMWCSSCNHNQQSYLWSRSFSGYSVKLLGWLQISASAPLLLLLAEARRFNLCSSSSRVAWFSFPANTWVCLSVQKLPKAVFYSLIEAIADRLPGWKASLIHSAGRATLVKAVLSSSPIYLQIALRCPKWVIKAIEKFCEDFYGKGAKT
jgi:hypothetical protein